MTARLALLAWLLLSAGCSKPADSKAQAAADARDIARVEAAQDTAPPATPLTPEAITFADIERNKLFGASCVFLPEAGSKRFVVLAMTEAAYLKLDGDIHLYAADSGSPPLPFDTRSRYVGRDHVIDLQTSGGEGRASGEETVDWPGRLTIRDAHERVVFTAAGTVQCGV